MAVLGLTHEAQAQLKGHYIPGFTGMENGSQPPPSISLAGPVYLRSTDTIKNDDGETIGANPRITAAFTGISLVCFAEREVLQ